MPHAPATVVVTGMGAVTPLGPDFPTTWRRLVGGETAAAPVTLFDVSGCRCKTAATAQIPELPGIRTRRFTRATRLALPAAIEALRQARLLRVDGGCVVNRLPMSVSTTGGGMTLGEEFMRAVRAHAPAKDQFFRVARYAAQQQLIDIQTTLGFRGPLTIIANACASGANALGHARDLIRSGEADIVLAGGYEALTELIYVGFDCLQALSPDVCRPFDKQRNGLMLGEAAAFLVLESTDHARRRGAEVLGVLSGYGHATDLHHLTQPEPRGQTQDRVIRQALTEASLGPDDVAYLNAHGTGTMLNDASECLAFQEIFQGRPSLRISSTKAAIGHTLGAAGAVEALFALEALRTGDLPPQINLREPEDLVAGQLVKPGERQADARASLSVNLGFGGSNAALVFVRQPDSGGTRSPSAFSIPSAGSVLRNRQDACSTLAIIGTGSVTGEGPQPVTSYGGRECLAYRVNPQDPRLTRWHQQPRLRRASAIALYMIEAAQQALDAAGGVAPARLGIVGAFGSGPLISSRRFYEGILKNGQRFAAPNLFPETVYNSATSHVAAVLGAGGPAYSLVGDRSAWVTALAVARRWLTDGLVDHVLAIGAEELDPLILDAYRAGRWLHPRKSFVAGEGAAAVVLRRAQPSDAVRLEGLTEGWTYRNRRQARAAAWECWQAIGPVTNVLRTSARNDFSEIEQELRTRCNWQSVPLPTYCGEAFAATAAWHTVQAVGLVQQGFSPLVVPIWGLNEQCSALLLVGG